MTDAASLPQISAVGPLSALLGSPLLAWLAQSGDRIVFAALAVFALPTLFGNVELGRRERVSRSVSPSKSNRILLAALFVLTMAGASLFIFQAVAVTSRTGMSPVVASLGFSLNAGGGLVGARLASRHRRPGWWLLTAGPAAFVSVAGGSALLYFVGMAWWGFAFWMGVPGVLRMLADRSLEPGERAGDAQSFMGIGRAIAPVVGAPFADAGSFVTLAAIAGAGIAAAGATVVAVQEGRERLPATDVTTGPTLGGSS